MKHTCSRMLFAYWDGLRGTRAAPDRAAIQPGAMRHILPDAFILAADEGDARFRLAGSRLAALFGRDLRERRFVDLWPARRQDEAGGLVDTVLTDTVGLVAGLAATNLNGSRVALELALLPLRHKGRTDLRLLGALSCASPPPWAGLVPIGDLEVTGMRIVGTGTGTGIRAAAGRRGGDAPRRSLFVVHEGGLT